MKLRERDKQDIFVFAWTGMNDDVYTWGERHALRASLYPIEEQLDAKPYGDRVKAAYLMLYDGDVRLEPGMGVSLDGGTPSLRIIGVERWSHTKATLEQIPEGRRL